MIGPELPPLSPQYYAGLGHKVAARRSGGCLSPVFVKSAFFASSTRKQVRMRKCLKDNPFSYDHGELVLGVRCRKCKSCTYLSSCTWAERAEKEMEAAKCSFFGTLTFSERFFRNKWREGSAADLEMIRNSRLFSEAEYGDAALAQSFADVPEFDERGRAQELKYLGRELTLLLKRLRINGVRVRYMATTEFGRKRGRPHMHFICHFDEVIDLRRAKTTLRWLWRKVGFIDLKPATDAGACRYAAKYISKSTANDHGMEATGGVRVRASIKYGRMDQQTIVGDHFTKKVTQDTIGQATMTTNEAGGVLTSQRTREVPDLIGAHSSSNVIRVTCKPARTNPRYGDGIRGKGS
jgi:hypothetical protein